MGLIVYRLDTDTGEYQEMGRFIDGEVVDDELYEVLTEETWQSNTEEELAAMLSGPRIQVTQIN